jgi:hypothetical protein
MASGIVPPAPLVARRLRQLSFCFAVALLVAGCGRSAQESSDHPKPASLATADVVLASREADDLGRFVAGLTGNSGSPFADLEKTDTWKEHHRLLDEAWRRADTRLVSGLEGFQSQELKGSVTPTLPVFYPFSGPDTLTMTLLFPQSPFYIMVGLEPAGTLPRRSQIEKKDLPKYLAETRETVASELGRSFFITRQMDRQFRGQVTDGLLVPMLHLLVRTHHKILGFRYVRLDDDGRIIDRASDYKAPTRFGNKGVELEFEPDGGGATHKLYYFSVNLSNPRLEEDKPFLTYLSNLKGTATMLKATSYMTHRGEFSIIRDQILANSAAVLQDDSGIPYHAFAADQWHVQLYGDYGRPYGSFRWMEQPDLRKAYASGGAKPLTLRLGYGYSRIASNLLLATRPADHPVKSF